MKEQSFIDACLEGTAFAEDIDTYVELWHSSEAGHGMTLGEYLGMTPNEYARWMKDSSVLIDILQEAHATKLEQEQVTELLKGLR